MSLLHCFHNVLGYRKCPRQYSCKTTGVAGPEKVLSLVILVRRDLLKIVVNIEVNTPSGYFTPKRTPKSAIESAYPILSNYGIYLLAVFELTLLAHLSPAL